MRQPFGACEEGRVPPWTLALSTSYGGILSVTFLVVVTKYKGDWKSQFVGVVRCNGEAWQHELEGGSRSIHSRKWGEMIPGA